MLSSDKHIAVWEIAISTQYSHGKASPLVPQHEAPAIASHHLHDT